MKFRTLKAALILLIPSITFSQQVEKKDLDVALFGKGVISTQDFEFNATFTPSEDTIYYTKSSSNFALMSIVYSTRNKNGTWDKPKLASFSGKYRNADPFISPDGTKLFFMSNRPIDSSKKPDGAVGIWQVSNLGSKWSSPEPVVISDNDFLSILYPSVASNGNLYFTAVDKESKSLNFYCSVNKDGKFQKPNKLNFSQKGDLDPIISADENFLVFASKSREGMGASDLYIAFNKNGIWSEPKALPYPINTAFSEGQPGISSDNNYLFFSSDRTNLHGSNFWGHEREEVLRSYSNVINELRNTDNSKGNIYYVGIKNLLENL